MRVLVTGHRGFTGRYLVAELKAHGHEPVGLTSNLLDETALTAEIATCRPEAVVHLSAVAYVAHGNANDFYRTNLIGTRNLLAALAAAHAPLAAVLLISSANIYGNTTANPITETTPPNPTNDYAVSKLAMEQMARLWSAHLPILIARPFNYTGVGQPTHYLIPKLVAHFQMRAPEIELGNLDVWRDYSDVRAVVAAYRRLIERPAVGATVNICSGTTYSVREILTLMHRLTGHTLTVRTNPTLMRANEVTHLCGSNALLNELIGPWQPPPLAETLTWMLQHPIATSKPTPPP